MKLSKRMQRLASLVTGGNRLADVGTDHGYIPIALVKEDKIPRAIAMDVNQGPLGRAGEHIREFGLSTYIETRLSDGLAGLKPGEADTVLIAGMGGMLMVRILEEGGHCLGTIKELILQPQSDIWEVRTWLGRHGFRIDLEDIVEEEGKYYPMFRAVPRQAEALSASELLYGKSSLQKSPEVWREFLQRKIAGYEKIREGLIERALQDSEAMAKIEREQTLAKGALEQKKSGHAQRDISGSEIGGLDYEVQ